MKHEGIPISAERVCAHKIYLINFRTELHKDPGIPNLCPFKEEMLAKIEAKREENERQKEAAKAKRKQLVQKKRAKSLQDLVQQSKERQEQYDSQRSVFQSEEGPSSDVRGGYSFPLFSI